MVHATVTFLSKKFSSSKKMHRAVITVCCCIQCLGATLKHPTLAHWHIHASSSSIQTNENSYTQTVSLLADQRISPHPQMLCMMDLRILQAGQRKDSPTPTVTKETCSGAGRRRLWCLTLSTTIQQAFWQLHSRQCLRTRSAWTRRRCKSGRICSGGGRSTRAWASHPLWT